MKKLILAAGLLGTLSVTAQSPDIIVNTRLDYDFSSVLVKKFRTLCKNFNMADPFTGRVAEPILLNESKIGDLLPADSKHLIKDFGNAVGLNILKADTKVWMHGLSYDVKGFKTNLKAQDQDVDGITIGTDVSAETVSLSADKVSLSLVIPGKNNSPIFSVDIVRPVIRASEDNLIHFFAAIKLHDFNDHYKLHLKKASFDQMAKGLVSNSRSIDLSYDKIIIPQVSLKIGNKTVNFSAEKIEDLIRSNHDAIKGILIAQAAEMLQSNTTLAALKVIEQYKIKKDYWLAAPVLHGKLSLGKFSTTGEGDIQLSLPGDFCTVDKFSKFKENCVNSKVTQTSASRLDHRAVKESMNAMNEIMANEDASIVASVSEDYVNKLLATAYDAGLLKSSLDEAGVTLGPNKITMRMDKKGDTATLLMDVVYKPTKMERILTGSKEIRFPLVIDLSVTIEKQDENPVIFVKVVDIDTSDETIINGRPDQKILSTVKDIPRFQGKVAKSIRERISSLRHKVFVELAYPELKGMDLDKVDFLSDGNGRMNAIVRLDDILEEERR